MPLPRPQPPAAPPKKESSNKPKNFTEIPRYLVKITSTLFKKATAAEIFLSRLEQRKNKLSNITAKLPEKNIIKVGESSLEGHNRENFIMNLMSEPSTNIHKNGRRKSVEVLMKGHNLGISGVIGHGRSASRLESLPGLITEHDQAPTKKQNLDQKTHKKRGKPSDVDRSFQSE